ncbi:AzlC family ABC transporter permease [Salimicrobium halophilum]|uniref:4-azaleucine resistance probable transporter AzlC n=1 Tax=Salimicrobium halophilum TaxID=86666 RepID=A0A1G8TLD5_9BACI|nr:AzlC family ABC transporter permease [Salimicrobium halophilum]SDJ42328.1 4-azaleucine resistance probable transporter AzlC [Salimicrobium halophilum]
MDTYEESLPSSGRIQMFRKGMAAGSPIILGYIPIALTYGVLAYQAGLSLWELTFMSIAVFAGAAQFLGVSMIAAGVTAAEIIIAVFVLNFRHFVMSLSFVNQIQAEGKKKQFPLTLLLTDETFAMSSIHKREANKVDAFWFYGGIMIAAYSSWVLGSLAGGLLGNVMPPSLSDSMGIALYAMFIGLLVPSMKNSLAVTGIALTAMAINSLGQWAGMTSGWAIVAGTILGGALGIFVLPDEEGEE